jgi:hypothetical protein
MLRRTLQCEPLHDINPAVDVINARETLNDRLKEYAPITRVKFFKQESADGRDAISAIVETSRRIFLWRVIVDENGQIAEMNIDEAE